MMEKLGTMFGGEKLNFKSVLFISLMIGLVIRIVCAPLLSYEYDSFYWGTIVQNINSGNGLYEVDGYYYTPVWGYVIGFFDMLWNLTLPLNQIGVRVSELTGIEGLNFIYHKATVTNPAFITAFKSITIFADIAVGYLIYKIVMRFKGDRKKAEWAFAFWFLCPIVFFMSSIQPMFDCVSALFILLAFLLILDDHDLLGGFMLMASILLKLFPAGSFLIIIAYFIAKGKGDKNYILRRSVMLIVGMVISFVVFLFPDFLAGDLSTAMYFITNRVSGHLVLFIIIGIVIAAAEMYVAIRIMRSDISEELDLKFNRGMLIALTISLFLSIVPSPQYSLVMIPFLIIEMTVLDSGYKRCYWIITIPAFLKVALFNFGLLPMAAEYYGIPSFDWLMSTIRAFDTAIFGEVSALGLVTEAIGAIYIIGLILVIVFALIPVLDGVAPRICSFFTKIKVKVTGVSE